MDKTFMTISLYDANGNNVISIQGKFKNYSAINFVKFYSALNEFCESKHIALDELDLLKKEILPYKNKVSILEVCTPRIIDEKMEIVSEKEVAYIQQTQNIFKTVVALKDSIIESKSYAMQLFTYASTRKMQDFALDLWAHASNELDALNYALQKSSHKVVVSSQKNYNTILDNKINVMVDTLKNDKEKKHTAPDTEKAL